MSQSTTHAPEKVRLIRHQLATLDPEAAKRYAAGLQSGPDAATLEYVLKHPLPGKDDAPLNKAVVPPHTK
jgi:hypothetical protein